MNFFAKISMDSLIAYSESVKQIYEYKSTAIGAASDFDGLIDFISSEIEILEEKANQLKSVKPVVENKIAEYKSSIEEKKLYITEKEAELVTIRSEKAVTPKYITYTGSDGHEHVRKNAHYESLVRQETTVEGKLLSSRAELEKLERCLNRCLSCANELFSVLSEINERISILTNSKNTVRKNSDEFNSTVKDLNNHTSLAVSKLSMIERCLIDYNGIQVNVYRAFENAASNCDSKGLEDLEYMTPEFKNAPQRGHDKSFYDDEGKEYKNSQGLVPNSTFKINNYMFTTDSLGRPATASGKLRLATEKKNRNWDSSLNEMGQGYEKPDDDRGHVIGHRFVGPDSIVNAFPQEREINQGEYKKFEDFLAFELESGKEIFISISTIYSGESRRPIGVAFSYTINGVRKMRFFDNEIKEGGYV